MTEGTRKLMFYRWFLENWKGRQQNHRAFYRPASEVLFSFRQYVQQGNTDPFFAVVHLRDCQNIQSVEMNPSVYHSQLNKLDHDMGRFLSWYQSQPQSQNTAIWIVGVSNRQGDVHREENIYTPLFLFHPHVKSGLVDEPIDILRLRHLMGQEQPFLFQENLLLPQRTNTSVSPTIPLQNISSPTVGVQ